MKIMAFSGTYRKGRTIDTLIAKAVEGVKSVDEKAEVEIVNLIEKDIKYCRNCMVCKKDSPDQPLAHCIIDDDMTELYEKIEEADGFIFGTPVNIGNATAVMKTFMERVCWVIGKPDDKGFPLKGCPVPRTEKKKKAIIIVSSGIVPPLLRRFCDSATDLIKVMCECNFGAGVVGNMYAGAVREKGVEPYLDEAGELGRLMARSLKRIKSKEAEKDL